MSKNEKMGVMAVFAAGAAALATMFVAGVGHVQGAKSSPVSPIYFSATLEPLWFNANGEGVATKIVNDAQGSYVNRIDTRTVKYGVTVKYTPGGGSTPRGQFVMNLDRAGRLGRYVSMTFADPVSGDNCLPKPADEEACAPVFGFMDPDPNVETRSLSISTQIVLDEDASGSLVRNVNARIDMDKMVAGQRKVVGLGISFVPDVAGYDYSYDLGNFTDPANYVPGLPCQDQSYPWGPAELVCITTGQVWEFRPLTAVYYNEPANCLRHLWGRILDGYWRFCRYNKWDLPFVLRVTKI